ncbi:MAG TPA: hypothetical protein VN709_00945 [Terriglobales bacterium]|nr:hypothetical protein [Terriglobales bacterium]
MGLVASAALMIGTNLLLVQHVSPASAVFITVSLAGAVLYHLLGGFLCAAVARNADAATAGLVIAGTLLLLSSVVNTWNQMPVWYSLAMVAIVPLSLWEGTRLHAGMRQRVSAT